MRAMGSDATQNAPIILEYDWCHCENPAAGVQLQASQHRTQETGFIYVSAGVLEVPGNIHRTLINYCVNHSCNFRGLAIVELQAFFFRNKVSCRPDCPQTYCVHSANLELLILWSLFPKVLRLQAYAAM